MKTSGLALVLVMLCVENAFSMPLNEIRETVTKVPSQEYINFLRYQISLGYYMKKKATHWPDVSNEFATALYHYALQFQIINPVKLDHAKKIICFEDGTCIDLGDPGVHPKSGIHF